MLVKCLLGTIEQFQYNSKDNTFNFFALLCSSSVVKVRYFFASTTPAVASLSSHQQME